jgi:hypothetical protein
MTATAQRRQKRTNTRRAPKKLPPAPQAGAAPDTPPADPSEPFPVDSYKEAARHLRRPFTAKAVRFKVQATWPKDNPTGALIVPYIDSRLVIDRLNLVCPDLWSERFEPDDRSMWCHLTIAGITRCDVGEGYTDRKGLVSDARKRAAVTFGIGVSLYASPKVMFNKSDGLLKDKRTRNGPSLDLTDAGEKRARALYEEWLAEHAIQAFGQPLDHGDVEGAIGDDLEPAAREATATQRERDRTPATAPAETPPTPPPADPEQQLAALLAKADPLQPLRRDANDGMALLGAPVAQRLRTLGECTDKRSLDALLARIHAAADSETGS